MQQRTWRRRNYFIKEDFQGKFVLWFFLAILIGAILFTFIFSLFSSHAITITYENSYLRLDKTPKALFVEIIRANGVYIFLVGTGISILSFFLSHRIAEPMFTFERSVEEVTKGNLSFAIKLRSRDEGKELAGMMNKMMETLSGRIRDVRLQTDVVHQRLTSLSKRLEDEKVIREEIRNGISEAGHSIENLKESLSFFKIDKG